MALLASTALVAAPAVMLAAANPAHAQSTWLGGTANYRQAGNWFPATPPVGAGQSAIFSNSGSTTVNIPAAPGPICPNSWTFTTNAQNYTFTGADVNFSVAGPAGGIISNANAGQTITVKNNIGESVPGVTVEVLGSSTLFLTAANTYSGGTVVLGGTIQAAKDTSFGTGLITLDKATLKGDGVHNLNIGNTVSVNNVFAPASTVDNAGQKLTLSGNIFGAGGLVFVGGTSGRTVLSGANTYTGGTTVSSTVLQANNNSALGTGPVTLDGGLFLAGKNNLTFSNTFQLTNNTVPGNFIDNNGNTLTIAGKIVDKDALAPGAVTFQGSGSTILTNANTYTGGTFVCACSTLQLGTVSNTGSIIGQIDNEGRLIFLNSDTSGITTLNNLGGALTKFREDTNAGTMTINNQFDLVFGPSALEFHQNASAGNATINNDPFSTVTFFNKSTAGNATINNFANGFGPGVIAFTGHSNAGAATINNAGGVALFDHSTLQNATLTNSGQGQVIFFNHSAAGFAAIQNNDSGGVAFNNHASADNATIVNNADGSLGGVAFNNHSTAGNAFITTNNGALTLFFDHSDGGTARFLANAGCHRRFLSDVRSGRRRKDQCRLVRWSGRLLSWRQPSHRWRQQSL